MSYILRALKKSQQERERGTVPRLSRAPEPLPAPRRVLWPWILGWVVTLNVAALSAFLLWPKLMFDMAEDVAPPAATATSPGEPARRSTLDRPAPDRPAKQLADTSVETSAAPVESTARAALDQPATPAKTEIVEPPRQPRRATAEPERGTPEPVVPPPRPSAKPVAARPAAPPVAAPPVAAPPAAAPPAALARAVPATATATRSQVAALSDLPPAVEVPTAEVIAPQPPKQDLDPVPDAYAALPLLRQLPYKTQSAIPDLTVSVHVYAEQASRRFVRINRKKYREGDQLGDNLTLEAIAPDGLVLRYRDTSFWIDR